VAGIALLILLLPPHSGGRRSLKGAMAFCFGDLDVKNSTFLPELEKVVRVIEGISKN
jgi:hypothetical protein